MGYQYVCKANVEKTFVNGYSQVEMPLDRDFPDIQHYGIKFYRCNLKAGATVAPQLLKDTIVLLMFNGSRAYINYGKEIFQVSELSFFIPDFDKQAYTVGAIEDTEFIMGVFPMNDWDKKAFTHWHKHLPFFKPYTEATEYGQSCKLPGTHSWTIIQGMMLGHVTVGVVRAIGAGTDEKGHPEVHQWNYCLPGCDFSLDVEGETAEQEPGDFSFIYAGKDHKLLAKPGKEVFYVWVEYYSEDDLTVYNRASVTNRSVKEAYDEIMTAKAK